MGDDKKVGIVGAGSGRRGAQLVVRVRRRDARLADPTPDRITTDITGGWEEDGVATLRVNRAGEHIEGWLQDYRTKQVTPIAGDLVAPSPETFQLTDSPDASRKLGTLHITDANELIVDLSGRKLLLRRTDRQPGLSDNAILAFQPEIRQQILRDQRTPVTLADRRAVMRELSAARLGPFIDRFHSLDSGNSTPARAQRAFVVQEIDRHVRAAFARLVHPSDRVAIKPWAIHQLNVETHTVGDRRRKLIAWLQDMVQVASVLERDPVPNMREHLGIDVSTRLFHYSFKLTLGGLPATELKGLVKQPSLGAVIKPGLGGGFFSGTLQVQEKDGPNKAAKVIAQFELPVLIGQVGLGAGISFGSIGTGSASTPFHWTRNDFIGPIKVVDLAIGLGRSVGLTGVFLAGRGTLPELATDFTGIGANFGASAGISEGLGVVGGNTSADPLTIPSATLYSAPASARASVHFPFGIAELTAEGRQLLRILAAQELALFRAPHAQLIVEAHADRVDTEEYNLLLTEVRAFNTVLAIEDIIRSKLREVHKFGLGETEAIAAGDPDRVENSRRRRADIRINGRLVVQLRGE